MFDSIIQSTGLDLKSGALCTLMSLAVGLIISLTYMLTERGRSRSMTVSLVVLPLIVQTVIMMVNGNVGTGVAVLGAFSLVRFRSAVGTAKEICYIFLAMAAGLATGMGYVWFGLTVVAVICAALIVMRFARFGAPSPAERRLRIHLPENLDYTGIFDDLFTAYAKRAELVKVKTVNLGSVFELDYSVTLTDPTKEKEFIDALRTRNGNLTVNCSRTAPDSEL